MFPGPNDIPATTDCLALANTGVDVAFPLIFGLIVVVLGIALFVASRARLRGSSIALGLVLLLGGVGLAVAPVSSAQADSCTPIDYAIDGALVSPATIASGQLVELEIQIINVVDRDGTTPIVVSIPKSVTFNTPVLDATSIAANWTFTETADAYLLTYTGPLPVGTMSSDALFSFAVSNGNVSDAPYSVPVSILSGSGGDTVDSNNTFIVDFTVEGIVA
jgi:hypothetical protein